MKIEIQRTDWIEFVYNKIKASKKDVFVFKVYTGHKWEDNTLKWRGDEVVSNIYISACKIESIKDRGETIKCIKTISYTLNTFIDKVTPLFLDSVMSLSYTDEQANAYVENVQRIKMWYDKGLFGEVESKFPVGAPQQTSQAHQL